MPSVSVEWTGRCPDRVLRGKLIAQLSRLGAADVLECRTFPGPVEVSSRVAPDPRALLEAASAAGLDIATHPRMGKVFTVPSGVGASEVQVLLGGTSGNASGRGLLRVTVLDAPAWPFLDGCLVRIDDGLGETFLRPSIRLAPHLEDWFCLLLCWVKHFYVADLRWRGRTEMQGHEDYRDVMAGLEAALGSERAEAASFESILATLAQHAEYWSRGPREAAAASRPIGE